MPVEKHQHPCSSRVAAYCSPPDLQKEQLTLNGGPRTTPSPTCGIKQNKIHWGNWSDLRMGRMTHFHIKRQLLLAPKNDPFPHSEVASYLHQEMASNTQCDPQYKTPSRSAQHM